VRITINLPETLFRKVKALAALRGVSLKQFITQAVESEISKISTQPSPKKRSVRLPLIPSKKPGTLDLANADIEDLLT